MLLDPPKLAVDATDMDILREMGRAAAGRFPSQTATLDEVGRILDLHPNTVAARVKRMQQGGGMGSRFTVFPNPNAVGVSAGQFFVPVQMLQRTQETLDVVHALGCTYGIIESLEGWTCFSVAKTEADLDALGVRICAAFGQPAPQWNMRTSIDWPKTPRVELDATDLAIFGAILEDGQAAMDDVAQRLGVPSRTVHRRYQQLRDANAFRLYPFGDAMMVGLAFPYLQLYLPPRGEARVDAEAALEKILTNRFTRQVVVRSIQYLLYGAEQGEIQAQVEEALAVPGVSLATNVQWRRMITSPAYPRQMMELLRPDLNARSRD